MPTACLIWFVTSIRNMLIFSSVTLRECSKGGPSTESPSLEQTRFASCPDISKFSVARRVARTVTLQVGTYKATIPAGSFHQLARGSKAGGYVFAGVIAGVTLEAQIVPLGNNSFQFVAEVHPVDLTALSN